MGRFSRARDRENCAVTPTKPYTAFFTKHTKEPDADAGADADRERPTRPSSASRRRSPLPRLSEKKHIHDPHWTGAAEFIRTNALNDNATGFAKDGFRDELITENAKKGDAVGAATTRAERRGRRRRRQGCVHRDPGRVDAQATALSTRSRFRVTPMTPSPRRRCVAPTLSSTSLFVSSLCRRVLRG